MERKRLKRIFRYLASAAVALVLLYFSFRGIRWDDFVSGLQACRWELIAVSMAAGIMAFLLRALRWRDLILPLDGSLGVRTVFNAINIGYIANFVFPRIGEFVRCGVITENSVPESAESQDAHPRKKASYEKVLGTVVLERGWDVISMLVVLLAVLLTGWDKFGAFFVENILEPFAGRFSFSIWWILAALAIAAAVFVWCLWKYRGESPLLSKLWSLGRGLLQGVGTCLKMDRKWRFVLYTLLIWGMYWLMSYSTMKALPELAGLDAADAMFLMVAGSLGWLVPVPGGFGAFHFIVSVALSTIYGIPFETGIVFATLSHESQTITMVLCGGCSYACEALRRG